MFASAGNGMGMQDLNQSSAGAIPINSMYDGEDERQAAIPPPMEGLEENNIEEEHKEEEQENTIAQEDQMQQ